MLVLASTSMSDVSLSRTASASGCDERDQHKLDTGARGAHNALHEAMHTHAVSAERKGDT